LQIDLLNLELDGDCGRRYKRVQHLDRRVRVHGRETLGESTPDAIDDLAVLVLCITVTPVLSLELVGLV
jgi:hypothetical protein